MNKVYIIENQFSKLPTAVVKDGNVPRMKQREKQMDGGTS